MTNYIHFWKALEKANSVLTKKKMVLPKTMIQP